MTNEQIAHVKRHLPYPWLRLNLDGSYTKTAEGQGTTFASPSAFADVKIGTTINITLEEV